MKALRDRVTMRGKYIVDGKSFSDAMRAFQYLLSLGFSMEDATDYIRSLERQPVLPW